MLVCLDSFALLTWLKDEPGAEIVAAFLDKSAASPGDRCHVAIINLCEVYYRLLRTKGQSDADEFWQQCLTGALPVTVAMVDEQRALLASRIKAGHPVALGDVFAMQLASDFKRPSALAIQKLLLYTPKSGLP